MAFLVKTAKIRTAGPTNPGFATLSQLIQVSRAAFLVPQSTSEQLFLVKGGRVLVHYLIGEVTTIMSGTDAQISILSKKLDTALAVAVGTAVTVASTTTTASLEVGGTMQVLGSGAALLKNNAGAGIVTLGRIPWMAPNGEIYATSAASSVTGAMKWDIWYQPLDAGARIDAAPGGTAII